ncbi:MAG: glycosyltransferase family 2 protein [Gammaproteobacteria bacterium]|nr:glycosyltransferase family 2 protein [Gammaproteobacteria bacterium]
MAQVDIIIPFYNVPIQYLQTALDSACAQTYADWKAIVVNDGSNSASTAEVEALLKKFPDDKIVYLKTANQGLAAARNNAIKASDSPYIALLDSDDAWYPHKLASQIAILEKHPDVGLVHADVDIIDSFGHVTGKSKIKSFPAMESHKDGLVRMMRNNFVACPTALFRRRSGQAVGFFDAAFTSIEDKMLWMALLANGCRFYYQNETVAQYRVHASNMSKNADKLLRGRRLLIERLSAMAQTNPIFQEIGWTQRRKEMVAHMFKEAQEGYIEQRKFIKALQYSYPFYLLPGLEKRV